MSEPESVQVPISGELVADEPMPALLLRPPEGTGPGVVLFQEIFGVSAYIRSRAADLAALGYVVVVPELYWRLDDAAIDESAPDALERALGVAQRLDFDGAVADGASAVAYLRTRDDVTDSIGLVGFCLGGGLAFAAAATTNPDVLVSYYGSALPQLMDLAPVVTAPSLHHFGTADSFIAADDVARIEDAVATRPDVVFVRYEGADHAFDNPQLPFHHPEASAQAWETTVGFLAEHLPT